LILPVIFTYFVIFSIPVLTQNV